MSDSAGSSARSQTPRRLDVAALVNHVIAHKIDCSLWVIRVLAIVFIVGYIFPISWSAQNAYYKALIANAAINALRLHQRLGRVTFSRQFITELLMEDSCHYLFYSMIFVYVAPVTLVLLPIALFAILHTASYSLTLLDTMGQNSWWGARLLISLVEFQSLNILRLIAFTEIVMMPLTVLLVFTGRASVLTPFIYYHFLTQRYASRRNPYNRNMFHEMKSFFTAKANLQSVSPIIRKISLLILKLITALEPRYVAAPPQQHQQ